MTNDSMLISNSDLLDLAELFDQMELCPKYEERESINRRATKILVKLDQEEKARRRKPDHPIDESRAQEVQEIEFTICDIFHNMTLPSMSKKTAGELCKYATDLLMPKVKDLAAQKPSAAVDLATIRMRTVIGLQLDDGQFSIRNANTVHATIDYIDAHYNLTPKTQGE